MLILHDPDTLRHETVELLGAKLIPAYESPDRIREILSKLSGSNHEVEYVDSSFRRGTDLDALLELIQETHKDEYLRHLKDAFSQWREANLIEEDDSILPECFVFCSKAHPTPAAHPPKDIFARPGYFAFDMSSGIMKETFTSAIASSNLAVQAIKKLSDAALNDVLALCRPPGHHCDGRRAGGYCYLNNCAIAVSAWRKNHSADTRIAILDVDFHHGNGTQDIFYEDPRIFYASIHGENEFPYYTGIEGEKGIGEGTGANLNLPLAKGSSFEEYQGKLECALNAIFNFAPELLTISLGFDTFHLDPLGSFKIYTEDYETMGRMIRQRFPKIPALLLFEGGYSIENLGPNLLSFLSGWQMNS